MGDDDQRAAAGGPCAQVFGQPPDRLQVEMVRGLVQQQDVGLGNKRRCQRHPSGLPSGQFRTRARHPVGIQQTRDDGTDPGIARPLVFRSGTHDDVPYGSGRQLIVLCDKADDCATADGGTTRIQRFHPREYPQEGRLARTVATHHPDPVAIGQAERDAVEDRRSSFAHGDGVGHDECGHP